MATTFNAFTRATITHCNGVRRINCERAVGQFDCGGRAPREMFAANSEQPGQRRPTGRGLPLFGHRDQAFALRQFPGSFARASDGFCLLAGFALGRFFVRLATLHLTKNALALHLLFEGPESLFDIVVANEYPQMFSDRGGPEASDSIKPGSNIGAVRRSRKGFNSAT